MREGRQESGLDTGPREAGEEYPGGDEESQLRSKPGTLPGHGVKRRLMRPNQPLRNEVMSKSMQQIDRILDAQIAEILREQARSKAKRAVKRDRRELRAMKRAAH